MTKSLADLQAEQTIIYSILEDVYQPTSPINIMTSKTRDKINFLFGKLNEIEAEIFALPTETPIEQMSFWKNLIHKL